MQGTIRTRRRTTMARSWMLLTFVFINLSSFQPGTHASSSPSVGSHRFLRSWRSTEHQENCEKQNSCASRKNTEYSPGVTCQCDPLCDSYQDCCLDADVANSEGSAISGRVPGDGLTCYSSRTVAWHSVLVVKRCPMNFPNNDIKRQCQNINDYEIDQDNLLKSVPVSEKTTGLVYLNAFCALCNGLSQHQILFWAVTIECHTLGMTELASSAEEDVDEKDGTIYEQILNTSHCTQHFQFRAPSDIPQPRSCIFNVIGKCPDNFTDANTIELCMNHTSLKYTPWLIAYRNKYCAICNGEDEAMLSCDTGKNEGPPLYESARAQETHISYKVLLDFNAGSGSYDNYGTGGRQNSAYTTCDMGYTFDPFTEQCRFLLCPTGFELKGGKCLPSVNEMSLGGLNSSCALLQLNSTEVIPYDNGSIFIQTANLTLNSSSYKLSEDRNSYLICSYLYLKDDKSAGWRNVDDEIQWLVSQIGVALSITALIVLIVIYSSFKQLQNIPGKCLLALSCSLLMGQFLFLLSSSLLEHRALCIISGTLMHFSFLASFCWMNVLAFDIWRTFTRQYQRAPKATGNQRFLRQTIYAFGVPFIIVTICLVVDLLHPEAEFRPNYGSHICWISNRNVLLLAFALPLSCVIVANGVFFAMSVYHIHQAAAQSAKIMKQGHGDGNKKRLLLYVKLSTIMGLTWVFGFIANSSYVAKVFWYLFIIFNSLQGVFIALGFLCNRTVFRLLKNAVKKGLGVDVSESGTRDSSRTTKTHSSSVSAI